MLSWQMISYKILLFFRLIQIPFLTGHRPLDDYGTLVETCLTLPWLKNHQSDHPVFNSTMIRTHVFPILSGELSSVFFTVIGLYSRTHPSIASTFSSISPFLVARLFSFLISLIIDYLIFRIAKFWRIKPNLVLFLYGSSYVPWVYFTFSRSSLIESILFCIFLYFVITSIYLSELDPGHPSAHGHGHAITGDKHRHGHSHAHGVCSETHDEEDELTNVARCAFILGLIFAMGISNRLNFAVFTLAPLVQWFLSNDGGGPKNRTFCGSFCRKLSNFVFGSILGIVIVAVIDSFVIGSLQIDHMRNYDGVITTKSFIDLVRKNFTVAAWNSLRVLLTFRSLANQSIHPWYTHILVNTPLVFGAFGLYAFLCFVQCFRLEVLMRLHYINARYWFLLSSFVVPLISLSIYPNKNPEDLTPLLIPLILVVVIRVSQYTFRVQARLISVWCAWNIFGVLYYGLLYNGGLYHCVSGLEYSRVHMQSRNHNRTFAYHFVAIDQAPSVSWFHNEIAAGIGDDRRKPKVFSYNKLEIAKFQRRLKFTTEKFTDVYAIVPSTVSICDLWSKNDYRNVTLIKKYYWHFSPEAPPNIWRLMGCTPGETMEKGEDGKCRVPCMESKWRQLYQLLSLRVYRF